MAHNVMKLIFAVLYVSVNDGPVIEVVQLYSRDRASLAISRKRG